MALIGPSDREEVKRLALRLEERGVEPLRIDSKKDPGLLLEKDRTECGGFEMSRVRGVYICDLGLLSPAGPGGPEASRRHLAAWNALLARLEATARVVNPPRTHDLHGLKPFEIHTYRRMGLFVPPTVTSSDPAAWARLPEMAHGWVTKGVVGGYGYTESFDPRGEQPKSPFSVRMVQARIVGDNVRAFVLGGKVLGAAQFVQRAAGTDSRRGEIRVRRIELPEEAGRQALAAAGHWGMHFAALDFMRDAATGRFELLECNSAPFFVNFEKSTGVEISGRLADFLIGRSR